MLDFFQALPRVLNGRKIYYSVSIQQINEYNSGKLLREKPGFIIHFHARKGWTPWGFHKSVNTSYYLTPKRAFKIIQFLNHKSKFVSFHMHTKNIWIISFIMNWYAHSHI